MTTSFNESEHQASGARFAEDSAAGSAGVSPERRELIETAVAEWRKRLVDLSGNNRLIYSRRVKGSLDLGDADEEAVDRLLGGQKVKLDDLIVGDDEPDPIDPDRVFDAAVKSVRLIHGTSQTNIEERGIRTLYLAYGTATWDAAGTSTATPNAPVLLAPLSVAAAGGSLRQFVFEKLDRWEINRTLLIFWQEMFGLELPMDEIEELEESHQGDPAAILGGLAELASAPDRVKQLQVADALIVGNFLYTKMPMVKDLEASVDEIAKNDLLAAIAGDHEATTSVRESNSVDDISETIPDSIDLSEEFLILDADSSQSFAINAALAGRSLVIKGPPGTGKSQTIANLIASLAAEGKSTLFVAEKRAAIEAVLKRLEGVGLGSLALDLHTNVLNRKNTALSLATSLQELSAAERLDVAAGQAKLTTARERLIEYVRELHAERAPWGLSSFEVNARLLEFGNRHPDAALDADVIARLDPQTQSTLADLVGRWTSTRLSVDWSSPWVDAPIGSLADADRLVSAATNLNRTTVPSLIDAVDALASSAGCALDEESTLGEIREVADAALAIAASLEVFDPAVWESSPGALADAIESRPLLGIGGEYRAAKKRSKQLSRSKLKRDDLVTSLRVAEANRQRWQALGPSAPPTESTSAAAALQHLDEVVSAVDVVLPELVDVLGEAELGALAEDVRLLAQSDSSAILIGQMNDFRSQLVQAGLEPVVAAIESGHVPEDEAQTLFAMVSLDGIRKAIDERNPVLNTFRPEAQSKIAHEFELGDQWHLAGAAGRVHRAVAERAIATRNAHPDQSALIEKEAKKKSRHKSLRQLHGQAGSVVQALRPCWMMSPLMVAQMLPARQCFDYVIFDEASQIRPEEAISAILRGGTLVVAGDEKQLPPSAFFSSGVEASDDDYDEDQVDALTSNYESILDVTAALLPSRMLTWHYRSRDERLIKLSNDHIYDRQLVTFPGAERDTPITFHKVDYIPSSTTETRSNKKEISTVVDLMIRHALERPKESLGVIAFGQVHASAIQGALRDRLEAESNSDLEAYFSEDADERVFVKNIERVQGDERDAIILTVGYGKDPSGKVPHRFGPVNQAGGFRRINVATSRARRRMAIVSSIGPSDLNTASLGQGPKLLEAMLRFAESGGNDSGAPGSAVPLNAFESAVKTELERLGLRPISQYGSSSYRIDFVIPHPDNDGRMVLAVEADGASYHSSPTARDRDRLRQQMLEGLGWRFHRIWSTAFFKDPRGEAQKVLQSYEAALRGEDLAPASAVDEFVDSAAAPAAVTRPKPRFKQGVPIADHDHRKLVALAQWINDDGNSLLTDDEIKEEMKATLGYARMGSRISEAFDRAIRTVRR